MCVCSLEDDWAATEPGAVHFLALKSSCPYREKSRERENCDGEEIDAGVQLIPEIPEGSTMTSCVLPSRRLGRPSITIKSRLKRAGSVCVGGIKEQILLFENK